MRDEVFVNLDHSPPRTLLILKTSFTANTSNLGIVGTSSYKTVQGVLSDAGIGINHEKIFIQFRVNANDIVDLVEHFQFERRHG